MAQTEAHISERIADPAAWTSAEIGGKAGLIRRLSPAEQHAAFRFMERTSDRPAEIIGRDEIGDPILFELGAEVRETILLGRGAVIITGLDMDRCTLDDFKRFYWAIGIQIGTPTEQSQRRDRIGYVQKEEDNPTGRGYLMDTELRSHTDFHEVLSLAGVRTAEEGGESGVVSSLAIHDVIQAERPELLPALYEGFYHEAEGEISSEKVPVFARVDGKLSCYHHPLFAMRAAKLMGVELPPELVEANAFLNEVASRPEIRADFMLEPGEMLFWHNFTALHSRRQFRDTPEHKRLLLRLWINVVDGRPMPQAFLDRAILMDRAHGAGQTGLNYAVGPVSMR